MASAVKNNDKGGKRKGQKYKSLLVWQYLLKHTDEDHAVSSAEIIDHLAEYGIVADRHSIARDVAALQELFQKEEDFDIKFEDRDKLKYELVYDTHAKGYKLSSRPYEFQELRLLAECVNAAKFLTERQADNLKELIGEFCSAEQAEELQNEVYLIGRVKTENTAVMGSILRINEAIKTDRRINFQYLKYTLQNGVQQVKRRRGALYFLSPFRLVLNEGNYYLLAYDSRKKDIVTYRVDRMKEVKICQEQREGHQAFAAIDMKTYTQRVFSMFSGEQKRVNIRFTNNLLDVAIERFGTGGQVFYRPDDNNHFIVSADVEISDQFYSWVCGFRKKAVIISPPDVVEGMQQFLNDIQGKYETE